MEEVRLSPNIVHSCHVCKLIVKTPLDNFFIYGIKKYHVAWSIPTDSSSSYRFDKSKIGRIIHSTKSFLMFF